MNVPKSLRVGGANERKPRDPKPAGFYSDNSDDDYDDDGDEDIRDDYHPYRDKQNAMSTPPHNITASKFVHRSLDDQPIGNVDNNVINGDSTYKTPSDSVLQNMNSFQAGDPVSMARQVRHLHNRVKLLENEMQTQQNRQIFLLGAISIYVLSTGIKYMLR